MALPISCRTGSVDPTLSVVPEHAGTELDKCLATNKRGGLVPLEWQERILEGWLGVDRDGRDARWTARTCGLSVPRQNGKTLGVVEARMNYGMLKGEQVIYTAHLQKTSTETFESMASFFDRAKLRKHVKDIKTALGREEILLRDYDLRDGTTIPGGRVKFLARTRNGGRGQHGSLLVFDEALELSRASQASFLPVVSAQANPQIIYAGTPPEPENDGDVFAGIREAALSGLSMSIAWAEWSVPEIGDVSDRDRWWASNPSMGILIDEETVTTEFEQMDEQTFAIERLGYWLPREQQIDSAIPAKVWEDTGVSKAPRGGLVAYGVKFNPDGTTVALAACSRQADGTSHVELVAVEPASTGTGWLASWLAQRAGIAACAVIDGAAGAGVLVQSLKEMRVPDAYITTPTSREVSDAASGLLEGLTAGFVTHSAVEGQSRLDTSARAPRRAIGKNGAWGFGSAGEIDSAPIEAASLALWGARTTKRDPSRRQVVKLH